MDAGAAKRRSAGHRRGYEPELRAACSDSFSTIVHAATPRPGRSASCDAHRLATVLHVSKVVKNVRGHGAGACITRERGHRRSMNDAGDQTRNDRPGKPRGCAFLTVEIGSMSMRRNARARRFHFFDTLSCTIPAANAPIHKPFSSRRAKASFFLARHRHALRKDGRLEAEPCSESVRLPARMSRV